MRKTLCLILLTIALAFPVGESGRAYAQKIVHDKQKEKQWRSIETGPWDFAPDWYYYFLHKKYSGAETYWKWSGFKSGYRVRFKEHKSNVKTVMPRRVAAEEVDAEKINVDIVYSTFKDDFARMQGAISEGLSFCLTKSKGKMFPQVDELRRQNDIVCRNISYIHKQGVGNELENAKREKAYIEYKRQMEELVSRVAHLVAMAQQYY